MEPPSHRDPKILQQQFADWLSSTVGEEVVVTDMGNIPPPGFSDQTVRITARWDSGDGVDDQDLALLITPGPQSLFPRNHFALAHRVTGALGMRPGGRVPRVLWYEETSEPLGAPFLVTEWIDGESPGDTPSYVEEGWLKDSPVVIQRAAWEQAVTTIASVHRVDYQSLGLGGLDPCRDGRSRLAHRIDQWAEMLRWASPEERQPGPEAGLAWLRENRPPDVDEPTLCWGDVRLGTMRFRHIDDPERIHVSALLSWGMAHVGDPVLDLGWFTWMDHALATGLDLPRLPGLPSYGATAERWESITLRSAQHLRWAEMLAAVGFAIIMVRLTALVKASDNPAPGVDVGRLAIASNALERALAALDVHPSDVG